MRSALSATWFAVAALMLNGLHAPAALAQGYDRQLYGVGEWRLSIARDRFSQEVICDLHARGGMRYVESAVGFQLGRGADVLQSWYRVDNGEPRRWRDQLPHLARLRVAVDGHDMDRPTGGMLWVPVDQLGDAKTVTIQRRPGAKPRYFSLDGFWRLYDYAAAHGCKPESRFVR